VARFDDFSLDCNSIQLSSVGTYDVVSKEIDDAVIGASALESLEFGPSQHDTGGGLGAHRGQNGRFIVCEHEGWVGTHGTTRRSWSTPSRHCSNTVAASLLEVAEASGQVSSRNPSGSSTAMKEQRWRTRVGLLFHSHIHGRTVRPRASLV
jgi:hypothetical protein